MKTNNCTKKKKNMQQNKFITGTHTSNACFFTKKKKKKTTKKLFMGHNYQCKHCRPGLDHIKKCGTIKVYTGCHPVYNYSSSPLQKKKKKKNDFTKL